MMGLQYIEYEDKLKSFYQINSNFQNGRCIQIHGLPGVGLDLFVDSFIRKYGERLKLEKHIYCCVIQCPKDHPKTLFIELIQEIARVVICSVDKRKISDSQQHNLRRLSELIQDGCCLEEEKGTELKNVEAYLKEAAVLCRSFADEVNIRLFIKNFDRSKKLFEQDINYAMLFKEISENYSDWLGITITIHRTLSVIALKIEAFSEFATLYDPFTIEGFDERQLGLVYSQMESALRLTLESNARDQIKHYCGGNPKRLQILFMAMEDLRSKIPKDQWDKTTGEDFVRQSFNHCNIQMRNHLERIIRCVDDLPGDGRSVLKEALCNRQSEYASSTRKLLFEMQVIVSVVRSQYGRITTTTIPILAEEIKKMETIDKTNEQQDNMRILHLSDLHFNSEDDEDDIELRKQYIYSFFDKLKTICQKEPIQYIFITGDIGYKAKENDYDQAERFISSLLRVCDLESERLFLCPGNHDVDRSAIEDYSYPQEQREADNFLTLKKLKKHEKSFQNYNSLCRSLKCLPYQMGENETYLTGVKFCEDCTIVCVNTAWFSKNDKMKKIWVGKNYPVAIKNRIDESYDRDCVRKELPVIAIMHHPVAYWEEQDCLHYNGNMNVWEMITRMSDIVLCGHTHETSDLSHMVNNSARICHGGVFYQEYTYMNSFHIYELKDKKCRKIHYQWINEKWMEDSEN